MRKSTLSHTTVFLLQVMRLAKLNKPPPSKVLGKNKPSGGLNRGFKVIIWVRLIIGFKIRQNFGQFQFVGYLPRLIDILYTSERTGAMMSIEHFSNFGETGSSNGRVKTFNVTVRNLFTLHGG